MSGEVDSVERHGIGGNRPPEPLTAAQIAVLLLEQEGALLKRRNDLQEALVRFKAKYPTIDDEDTLGLAGDFKKQIQACIAIAKDHFTKQKKPFLDGGRAVDAFFASITSPLTTTLAEVNKPMTEYGIRQEAIERAEREAKAAAARQEADRVRAALLADQASIDHALAASREADKTAKAAAAPAADLTRNRGDGGSVNSLRETWAVELVNLAEVPLEFLMFDQGRAARAVAGPYGLRTIPGCRVFKQQTMVTK